MYIEEIAYPRKFSIIFKKNRKYIFQRLLVCKELIDIKIEIDEKSHKVSLLFFKKKTI